MSNRWNPTFVAGLQTELDVRAYTSRLLGDDPALVLHGGGNTSLKGWWKRADGAAVRCLYVKGSGADLARVEPADFTPVALDPARALLDGPALADDAFMAALAPLVLRPGAPRPSIETLMHAVLPASHVEHTHADNVLALVNTESGERIARAVFGERAPLVPFRHSGFELARACADVFAQAATDATIGLVLAFHGVVAFGNDAESSYRNMLCLAQQAEDHLRDRGAWDLPRAVAPALNESDALDLARLRRTLSAIAGFPLVLVRDNVPTVMGFVTRNDLAEVALQGPPTPQHSVFTKRLPCLGLDVARYAAEYREYLTSAAPAGMAPARLPDAAARVVLDRRLGMIGAGLDCRNAGVTAQVYRHDIEIVSRANAHDRYLALPPDQVLAGEIHYGGFERKRRAAAATVEPLLGALILVLDDGDDANACAHACRHAGADVFVRPASRDLRAIVLELALAHGGVDLIASAKPLATVPDAIGAILEQSPFAPAAGAARVLSHRDLQANAMQVLTPVLRTASPR